MPNKDPQDFTFDFAWMSEILERSEWRKSWDQEDVYIPLKGDGEIVRVISDVPVDDVPRVVEFLNVYTDISNYNDNPGVRCNYVTDPIIEEEVSEGRYRNAFVRRIPNRSEGGETSRVIQVLRKGFMQAIDWDESRLFRSRAVPADNQVDKNPNETYVFAEFVGVDPTMLRELQLELTNATVPGRVIVGEEQLHVEDDDDAWHVYGVDAEITDDGSGRLVCEVAHAMFSVDTIRNNLFNNEAAFTYVYNVPKYMVQDVIDTYKAMGDGIGITPAHTNRSGYFDLVVEFSQSDNLDLFEDIVAQQRCSSVRFSTYYFGATEDQIPDIASLPQAAGTTYELSKIFGRSDGKWDFVLYTTVRSQTSVGPYTSYDSTFFDELESKYYGVTDYDALTIPENAIGKTVRVDRRLNDDCSEDVVIQERDRARVSTSEWDSRESAFFTRTTERIQGSDTPETPYTQADGTIVTHSRSLNEDGTEAVELEKVVRHELPLAEWVLRESDTSITTEERLYGTVTGITFDPRETGETLELVKEKNEDGTETHVLRRTTAQQDSLPEWSERQTCYNTTTTAKYTGVVDGGASLTIPAKAVGNTIAISKELASDGSEQWIVREDQALALEWQSGKSIAPGYEEVSTRKQGLTAAEADPTEELGHIKRVVNRLTEYCTYDADISDRENNDLSFGPFAAVQTPQYDATREMVIASTTEPILAPGEYGSVNVTKQDDGLYYGSKEIRTYNTTVDYSGENTVGSTWTFLVRSGSGTSAQQYRVWQRVHYTASGAYSWLTDEDNSLGTPLIKPEESVAAGMIGGGYRTGVMPFKSGWWLATYVTLSTEAT